MSSYANLDSRECTIDGEETFTFNWKPRKIIITNDSPTKDLKFKFNTSEEFATLKPTETITFDVAHKIVILYGLDVDCRLWGIG